MSESPNAHPLNTTCQDGALSTKITFMRWTYSILLAAIMLAWSLKYTVLRRARGYAKDRQRAGEHARLRRFSKIMFVGTYMVTCASLWSQSAWLGVIFSSERGRAGGFVLLIFATALYFY